jgi:hypothetical protein
MKSSIPRRYSKRRIAKSKTTWLMSAVICSRIRKLLTLSSSCFRYTCPTSAHKICVGLQDLICKNLSRLALLSSGFRNIFQYVITKHCESNWHRVGIMWCYFYLAEALEFNFSGAIFFCLFVFRCLDRCLLKKPVIPLI